MKIAGIVAEYNPFHNGHKYHIEKTKEATGADAVVAIMSGNFVQRGDCAIADKWTRAKAAIMGGVDLVIELPVYYALSVAPLVSFGAVSILNALGCIDYLSFGTEADTLSPLSSLADALIKDKNKIDEEIQKHLDNYTGYPVARQRAIESLYGTDAELLQNPNNMLALEYLQTLAQLKSNISPIAIKRMGAHYHDTNTTGEFASAAALRTRLLEGKNIDASLPKEVYNIYNDALQSGLFPMFTHNFDKILLSFLRRAQTPHLKDIIDMPHGFENRIVTMSKKACTIDELTELCCVRQYTRSRVRRLLFASYIGIHSMGYDIPASYVRVLAANDTGRRVLAKMNDTCSLPIITKVADYEEKDSDALFLLDVMSTDLYATAYDKETLRIGGKDFTTSPLML